MFTKEEPVSLTNLGEGAAIELFNEELQKVLDNIVDPNTKPKQAREVVLRVKITPDEERDIGDIEITCISKPAPAKGFTTKCILGRTGKHGEARELQSAQTSFLDKDNVVGIESVRQEEK